MNEYSCLNGWTFGNIIVSAHDEAMFFYHLLATEKILKKETQELMQSDFEPSTRGFKVTYGLGLLPIDFPVLPD